MGSLQRRPLRAEVRNKGLRRMSGLFGAVLTEESGWDLRGSNQLLSQRDFTGTGSWQSTTALVPAVVVR